MIHRVGAVAGELGSFYERGLGSPCDQELSQVALGNSSAKPVLEEFTDAVKQGLAPGSLKRSVAGVREK